MVRLVSRENGRHFVMVSWAYVFKYAVSRQLYLLKTMLFFRIQLILGTTLWKYKAIIQIQFDLKKMFA